MDITLIINRLKDALLLKNDAELASFLEISHQNLSNWKSRNSIDWELIFTKCEHISYDWLLTGKGEMLKADNKAVAVPAASGLGIPLIPTSAIAGMFSGSEPVFEYECERFIVPTFRDAEFLISVKGSSMVPKYNSGDIVACKRLPLDTFFQWNKVYVLDTEQGALIKRVRQGSSDNSILIVSENERYPAFELHRSKIYHIALVIGVIRLE